MRLSSNGYPALALACACVLAAAAPLVAATYYLDAASGDDAAAGTEAAPWRTWAHAQGQLAAGDTLVATGEIGYVAMGATYPIGTAEAPIVYRRWPGRAQPHITTLDFDGTQKDAYLEFRGFRFDPGYVESAGFNVNVGVDLDGANYVTFDDCDFEGPKLLGAEGPFAPYCMVHGFNPPAVTAGHPGNASHITIRGCRFSYANTAIRLTEHPNYPDRQCRYWEIVDNDFRHSAEDFITIGSGGGNSLIARNVMREQHYARASIDWPGTATGTLGEAQRWAPMTQDATGASAMFYGLTGGRIYLLADDADHIPRRNTTDVWRLDADPENVYFTPSGTGDSTHGDCIAIQGYPENMVLEGNHFETAFGSGQALKLDYIGGHPKNILIQNNLFFSRTAAPTYLILLDGGVDVTFRHNIVYPGPDAPMGRGVRLLHDSGAPTWSLRFVGNIISGGVSSAGEAESDYNVWLSTPPAAFNAGPHTTTVASLAAAGVLDAALPDFRLAAGSPARDAGDPNEAPGVSGEFPEGIDRSGLARDAAPDIGPYEYRLRMSVVSWQTVAEHGAAGRLGLALTDGAVEPRSDVDELRITFDVALDPATVADGAVTIAGRSHGALSLPPGALSLGEGNTVIAVALAAGLLDDVWTVTLAPSIVGAGGEAMDGDRVLELQRLAGDVDGSGEVGPGDVVATRAHSGGPVTDETCRWDVDTSGRIDGSDLHMIRLLEGHALP